MSQIHKRFTCDEVKELLGRYSKKEIERKYIQEILGIGKSRFFKGPTTLGRLYGFTHIDLLTGLVSTALHLVGGFWAYMGGFLFNQTRSYRFVFIKSSFMAAVAFLLHPYQRKKTFSSQKKLSMLSPFSDYFKWKS